MQKNTFTIDEWCQNNGLSRSFFYKLRKEGRAPKVSKVGRRSIITRESDEEWRQSLNREAA